MRITGMRGRRVDTAQKVRRELQVNGLADLPAPDAGEAILNAAYDHLLTELARRMPEGTTFAVTSALRGEGRSTVVASLALAAARRGLRVLVIDADLRAPSQHTLFNGEDAPLSPGLLEMLVGNLPGPIDATHETPVEAIRVLPAGSMPVNDVGLLFGSRTMERFLQFHAPQLADLVLIDAPPTLGEDPGLRLLPLADGVVYVVRLGETDSARARAGLSALTRMDARVVGGVFLPAGDYAGARTVRMPNPGGRSARSEARARLETLAQEPNPFLPDPEPTPPVAPVPAPVVPDPVREAASLPIEEVAPVPTEADEIPTEANDPEENHAAMSTSPPSDDPTPEAPAPSTPPAADPVGVGDLGALLSGWRRRDYVAAPVDPAPASPEPPPPAAPIPAAPPVAEEAPVFVPPAPQPEPPAAPPVAPPPAPQPELQPLPAAPTVVFAAPPAPVPDPVPAASLPPLEVAFDMAPSGPDHMVLRAATVNAADAGLPSVVLELTLLTVALRGMRGLTPSGSGPRIDLEAHASGAPGAAGMRLLVGEATDRALEAVLDPGASVVVQTGSGERQPPLRMEFDAAPGGGTRFRASLAVGAQLLAELSREPVDGPGDARWRYRLALSVGS